MGFKKVYTSLQDIFPQIDARVLRAVAIEHSKDVDKAVAAVLEEIIPFFSERSTPSTPLTHSSFSVCESSQGAVVRTQTEDGQGMNTSNSDEQQNGYNVNNGIEQSFNDADDVHNEPFYGAYDGRHDNDTAELMLSEKLNENRIEISADMSSHGEPIVVIDKSGENTLQIEVSGETHTEAIGSGNYCPERTIKASSNFDTSGNEENDLENGNNPVDGNASFTVDDVTVSPLESSVHLVENEGDKEKLEGSLLIDTALSRETMSNIIETEYESSTLNPTLFNSSQINAVDVIEEVIADARNNKKKLFLAMESVISLMRDVELKEKAKEKAKEEAALGGTNILLKVEGLKQMRQRAKEANDMHAGEVYGEKAILATELRELQSRVLSLSDDRDKSLAVLHEMRQTLELRLAAAENAIKSVEQEKLEKEKEARKSLADQELIMEKVVEESKILKKQGDDNAKLQEFLLDRGRAVDMLQGEIAVICQDVRLLKEKFDECVPFSKSLFSSQTSFALASSSSSLKSSIPDPVELVPVPDDFLTQKKKDNEQFSEEESARIDRKALVDDGWEIFDNREINV